MGNPINNLLDTPIIAPALFKLRTSMCLRLRWYDDLFLSGS